MTSIRVHHYNIFEEKNEYSVSVYCSRGHSLEGLNTQKHKEP